MAEVHVNLQKQCDGEAIILQSSAENSILQLTLNRPKARNSLSEAMILALETAFDTAGRDPSLRAIVLTGNGPAFCAGHDLKELSSRRKDEDRGRGYYQSIMQQCARMMQSIVRCPKPVIAAVQATASAAGCQLVATCDLAVASETAQFSTPGVNIGLFCSTPMVALSRNIPRKRAMEMLLLGDFLSASEAVDYGLVNRVVAHDEVVAEARAMAERVAAKSATTVAIGKEAFYAQIEMSMAQAYDYAADVMVTNMLHRDAEEGIGAFLDKRPPNWQD